MNTCQWFPVLRANATATFMPMALPLDDAMGIDIMNAVCAEFGVSVAAIKGPRRQASIANARQMFMLLARQYAKHLSYPQIGNMIRRDHTTVVHGARRAASRVDSEDWYAAKRRRILARLAYAQ